MKTILCTLAAILVVGAFTVHPADAACWWNGWAWQCVRQHYHWVYGHPYWHPYWSWHHWRHW